MGRTMKVSLSSHDVEALTAELKRMNAIRFDAVQLKNLTQMLNRARNGGTPVDTGELRLSSSMSRDEMGYMKEYGPHVEYGHRTVDGGYVEGQRFLQKNVNVQRNIYKSDLLVAIRKR